MRPPNQKKRTARVAKVTAGPRRETAAPHSRAETGGGKAGPRAPHGAERAEIQKFTGRSGFLLLGGFSCRERAHSNHLLDFCIFVYLGVYARMSPGPSDPRTAGPCAPWSGAYRNSEIYRPFGFSPPRGFFLQGAHSNHLPVRFLYFCVWEHTRIRKPSQPIGPKDCPCAPWSGECRNSEIYRPFGFSPPRGFFLQGAHSKTTCKISVFLYGNTPY